MLRVLLIKTLAGQRRDSPIGRDEGVFQALLAHDLLPRPVQRPPDPRVDLPFENGTTGVG